jgi:hypothetical protein
LTEEPDALVHVAPDAAFAAVVRLPGADARRVTSLGLDAFQETLRWPTQGLGALAVSRNGRLIFSQPNGHTAEIDLREPTIKRRYYMEPPAARIQLSDDGKTLARALRDGVVQIWAVEAHRRLRVLRAGRADAICFAPGGRRLAIAGFDGRKTVLSLWNPCTGRRLRRLALRGQCSSAVCFSPSGNHVAAVGNGLVMWDVRVGTRSARIPVPDGAHCAAVAFLAGGRQIAAGCSDGTVRLWDWRRRRLCLTLQVLPRAAERGASQEWIAYTPEGYYAASEHAGRWIRWRRGARVLPASAYKRDFHRLDLVRKSIKSEPRRTPKGTTRGRGAAGASRRAAIPASARR